MLHKNAYQTNSLALASAISLFIPLSSIEKDLQGRCVFSFPQSPELSELVAKYWNKELRVDAFEHFTQIKSLKARVYEII